MANCLHRLSLMISFVEDIDPKPLSYSGDVMLDMYIHDSVPMRATVVLQLGQWFSDQDPNTTRLA